MRRDKLNLLKEILESKNYIVNIESGKIYGLNKEEVGYVNSRGTQVVNLYWKKEDEKRGRIYQYTRASLIAFQAGLFEEVEDPDKYFSVKIDIKIKDYSINNIRLILKTDYFKEYKEFFTPQTPVKKKISYKYNNELREIIRKMYYKENIPICKIRDQFNIPYSSVSDIIKK